MSRVRCKHHSVHCASWQLRERCEGNPREVLLKYQHISAGADVVSRSARSSCSVRPAEGVLKASEPDNLDFNNLQAAQSCH